MATKLKKKIAIIGNAENDRTFLALFKSWQTQYQMAYHVFDSDPNSKNYAHFHDLYIYERNPEYPGYMLGLESNLGDVSCAFLLDAISLCCFQAARFARKFDLPYIVILSEFQIGLYKKYKNLDSIQFDVLSNATEVWSLSKLATDLGKYYSVASDKIKELKLPVDDDSDDDIRARRTKFRQKLELKETDILCVFSLSLEEHHFPQLLLQAAKIVNKRCGNLEAKLKVLFYSDGSQTENLKIQAFELGLGQQIMFLTKNRELVENEILASADIMVFTSNAQDVIPEKFPFQFLRAMSNGVLTIYNSGTVFEEFSYNLGICLKNLDDFRLGLALSEAVESHTKLNGFRWQRRSFFQCEHEASAIKKDILLRVDEIFNSRKSNKTLQEIFTMREAEIRALIEMNKQDDADLLIEEGLINYQGDNHLMSCLLNLKARVYMDKGNLVEALECFIESVKINGKNTAALRNLGIISWLTHAHEEAITYFRKALSITPDDGESLLGLGLIYQRIGINDEAYFWLEKALAFSASEKRALNAIIQIAKDYQDKNFSRKILEITYENIGDYVPLLVALGETCLALGDNKRGTEYLQQALSLEDGIAKIS